MEHLTVIAWALIGLRAAALVLALVVGRREPVRTGADPARADPCLGPVMGIPPALCPEGRLRERLLTGDLSRREYRRAMALIAEQEEREHPLPLT